MKKRPLAILLITFICIAIAPLYLAYQMWFHSLDPMNSVLNMNPVHLAIALLALPVGFGVYTVQKWGYFSFLSLSSVVVVYFLYQYFTSPVLHNYLILIAAVLIAGSVSLLLQKHITAPYFNPKLKWWERHPRFRVNLTANFQIDGDNRMGSLLDLSMSGCYASVDSKLSAGDTIYVHIQLLDFRFKAMAKVIWANHENGGYGIMFADIDRANKKELRSVLNYLSLSLAETNEDFINVGVPKQQTTTTAV